jgi:cytidine deaminase
MKPEKLMEYAMEAMGRAYAPYSGFCVGAALLCADGAVYQGCNIENAAFSPTICAERTAFAKAVSEGQREFVAIAICGGKEGKIETVCTPCGVCRQVMAEFCKPDFQVYMAKADSIDTKTLEQLLPNSFVL